MWEKELEIAKKAAVEAGIEIMEIYNNYENIEIEYKEKDMPLTIADKKANKVIVENLKREFPDYSILSEEEKDDFSRLQNDLCFIVDPLDGTKEFIKRNGQFTVNIALSYKNKSVVGVIYVPVTKELYYAVKNQGSYLQKDNKIQKLQVSYIKENIRAVISNSHGCEQMDMLIKKYSIQNYVNVGSSLKGCMIAKGDAEVYYRFNPTMEWDTAAMQCIAEEAGAIFKQMDNSEMLYNRKNSLNEKGFFIINCIENKMTL